MTPTKDDRYKEDVLKRADLTRLCERLGLDPKGKVARCPAHNDTGEGRPNLAIYKESVHCFRCDFHADAIGLVEKAKNLDFKAALAYLADFVGMPPQDKAQGLGNRSGADNGKVYPKAAPLPPGLSPTLGKVKTWPPNDYTGPAISRIQDNDVPVTITGFAGIVGGLRYFFNTGGSGALSEEQILPPQAEDLGNKEETKQEEVYPKTRPASTDGRPPLPRDKWVAGVADFGEARSLQLELSKEYITALGKDAQGFYIAAPAFDIEEEPPARSGSKRTLRAEVFAAFVEYTRPAADNEAPTVGARWLQDNKGLTFATQERAGLRWLHNWQEADKGMKERFNADILKQFGLLNKNGDLHFKDHRLIFPFRWKGEVVFLQGRNIAAKDKQARFCNLSGNTPILYNADTLAEAQERAAPVFICEGATDTLTLLQAGRLAVGVIGTQGLKARWVEAFRGLKVFFAFDSDEAGQEAAAKYARLFFEASQPTPRAIKLPEGVKDINEFFKKEFTK